jgi:5'-deoxynucleotidase YfbR-like HD superfamily hydrolase
VNPVINPDFEKGMFSSVVCGVRALAPETEAFFLLPADIFTIRIQTISHMREAMSEIGRKILYPTFLGQRGHPPLLSASFVPEIVRWQEDGGLRIFLAEKENFAKDVNVPDEGILLDLDTPSDLVLIENRWKKKQIPTRKECRALFQICQTPEPVIEHGKMVCKTAFFLANALYEKGLEIDLPLIRAAGLLHDISKGHPDHARHGGNLLRRWGFGPVAEIVENHMDIDLYENDPITEAQIVYLADKLTRGTRPISLQEHFNRSFEKKASNPEALVNIRKRQENAEIIKNRIESVIGFFDELTIENIQKSEHDDLPSQAR